MQCVVKRIDRLIDDDFKYYTRLDSRFNGNVAFSSQTCGKSVPTSKYLPIRAGTSTGSTRFEVMRLGFEGWIRGSDRSKYKLENYKLLFYAYVAGQITVFTLYLSGPDINKIDMQVNRNEIKSINADGDNRCVTNSTDGCELRVKKLRGYQENKLWISLFNGWNYLGLGNIVWGSNYQLYIYLNNTITQSSFIPWNTTLANECAKWDQQVIQNPSKVDSFELDMRFTYGQRNGLNTVLSCFNEIASENKVNVTINSTYIFKYTIVKFEAQGDRNAKNEFYKLLAEREKIFKCIENSCIYYKLSDKNAPEHENIQGSDFANKTLVEKKLQEAAAGVKEAIDALQEISTIKKGPVSAVNKLIEKLNKTAAGIKELINISDFANKTLVEKKLQEAAAGVKEAIDALQEISTIKKGPVSAVNKLIEKLQEAAAGVKKLIDAVKEKFKKGLNSVPEYSYLNTERVHSSVQKLIVYIVAITVVALLIIAAGVFAFKTQQAKSQKDVFTDQSVLRKWTNEN